MNESAATFVLRDRRSDGSPRDLARFADPAEVQAAREALLGVGDESAEIVILEAVDPLEQEVQA